VASPIVRVGDHVELHPGTDRWMRGDKFGTVTSVSKAGVGVRFDRSGQTKRVAASRIGRLNGVFVDGVSIPAPKRRVKVANPSRGGLPVLTARDKETVRAAYRRLDRAYDSGRSRETAETVMLSSGYADVQYWPDDTHVTVWRHGQPTRVSTTGPKKVGIKHKAGSKTRSRKKVSSRKVANPARKRTARKAR